MNEPQPIDGQDEPQPDRHFTSPPGSSAEEPASTAPQSAETPTTSHADETAVPAEPVDAETAPHPGTPSPVSSPTAAAGPPPYSSMVSPPVSGPVLGSPPNPVRRGWTPRGTIIAIVAVMVAVGMVIGVALYLLPARGSAAEDHVLGYFRSLSAKDGKAAGEYLDAIKAAETPLWDAGALVSGYEPPSRVEVISSEAGAPPGVPTTRKREYATVTVSYVVGRAPASEMFVVDRKSGGEWRIIAARLGQLSLGEGPTEFQVAGTHGTDSVLVPPGAYRVTIEDDALFEDSTSTVAVSPGIVGMAGNDVPGMFLPDLTVRTEVVEEVEAQVKAVIDECASELGFGETSCPWKSSSGSTSFYMTDAWDVKSYPDIEVVLGDAGLVEVETTKPGEASGEDSFEGEVTVSIVPAGPVIRQSDGSVLWEHNDHQF
jgi:hypothetical protein